MKSTIQLKTATPLLLITLALVCFGFLPKAQAVEPAAPDTALPGGNTADGQLALASVTTGLYNSAFGIYSLLSLTDGNFCTGVGAGTLLSNTADGNTATGAGALLSNTIGEGNTANGTFALFSNTEGNSNTATGDNALLSNTEGDGNTADGFGALNTNTTSFGNTAIGFQALFSNTEFGGNTAVGAFALLSNTSDQNTAIGLNALIDNTIGLNNTAVGVDALDSNTTGSGNIALGAFAGAAVTTANNVIAIGTSGADVDNSCFIGFIRDVQTANDDAIPVVIDSTGQLGTASSSKRFKKEIKPMKSASEAILALKPVTFRYKGETKGTPQFGLIAEEVAEVNPDLVVRDKNREIYTVRYDAVNAMLLNEFLKAHKAIEEQRKEIDMLKTQLKGQMALIQRVSDKVDLDQSMRQLVANEQ